MFAVTQTAAGTIRTERQTRAMVVTTTKVPDKAMAVIRLLSLNDPTRVQFLPNADAIVWNSKAHKEAMIRQRIRA